VLKLNHLRYSTCSSNLGVEFLRRNFNVHCVYRRHPDGRSENGLLRVHKYPSAAISTTPCHTL